MDEMRLGFGFGFGLDATRDVVGYGRIRVGVGLEDWLRIMGV